MMKGFILAAGAAALLGACSSASAEPEAAIEELARSTETGRCERIPQLISSAGREMIGPMLEAACKEAQEQRKNNPDAKAERKFKQMNVISREESGTDRVTLRAEPVYEDGSKTAAQNFVLVREEGEWKLDLLATGMAAGAGGVPGGAKQ